MRRLHRWYVALATIFTILRYVECGTPNCYGLQPPTDIHLTFDTRIEDDASDQGAKWTLIAVGSWQRPAGGDFTGYGVKLQKSPHSDGQSTGGQLLNCLVDVSYTVTSENTMTFSDVEYGFHYRLTVRTIDGTMMQINSGFSSVDEFSPDCYEETGSVEFCSSREVETSGKPVNLSIFEMKEQATGLVDVTVSWNRPIKSAGTVVMYKAMWGRPDETGGNQGGEVVIPAKENDTLNSAYEFSIEGLDDQKEYQFNVTPMVLTSSRPNLIPGYKASLTFIVTAPAPAVGSLSVPQMADSEVFPRNADTFQRRKPETTFEPTTAQATQASFTGDPITPSPPSSDNLLLTASVAVGVALAFVIAMSATTWCCVKRKKKEDELKKAVFIRTREEEISMYHHKGSIQKNETECRECLPEFEVKELDRTLLKLEKELGSGQFGVVYKGYVLGVYSKEEYSPVAVKSLKCNASQSMKEDFLDEIKLIIEIGTHPNILPVLGCCTVDEPYYLITEYMKYGDLLHFLWKCREENRPDDDHVYIMTETNKIQIARQIARGMEYLSNTRYYHGDLAARNVLVGEDLVVKISDFGLADDIYQNGYKRLAPHRKRPVKWVSLETNLEGKCTIQSDVWSFGIVLYEIYTLGSMPYPGLDGREVVRRLQTSYRMDKPDNCPDEIYDIMRQCWREKPTERPTFTSLFNTFDRMLVEQSDYMLPLDGAVYDHCLLGGGGSGGQAAKTGSGEEVASTSLAAKLMLEDLPKSETEQSDTVRLFPKE
ncbi:uncharacterized protein [Asterias amurensis]|uniref:uncharacterized protein n=1 Tax=Asterias amurensis TaxID=7602 RepID=UPI003AB444AA